MVAICCRIIIVSIFQFPELLRNLLIYLDACIRYGRFNELVEVGCSPMSILFIFYSLLINVVFLTFKVNPIAVNSKYCNVFTENKRVVSIISTRDFGKVCDFRHLTTS